jgi:hypothetical protein
MIKTGTTRWAETRYIKGEDKCEVLMGNNEEEKPVKRPVVDGRIILKLM